MSAMTRLVSVPFVLLAVLCVAAPGAQAAGCRTYNASHSNTCTAADSGHHVSDGAAKGQANE